MDEHVFGIQPSNNQNIERELSPLRKAMRESTERMQTALLAASMDNPGSVAAAMRQVTLLRAHHQVLRIVKFLQLMDEVEEKMYESIELDMATMDLTESSTWSTLLALQTKLQQNIIESNKLLAPYLEMDKYPLFQEIAEEGLVIEADAEVIDISADKRNQLRETATLVLEDLQSAVSQN